MQEELDHFEKIEISMFLQDLAELCSDHGVRIEGICGIRREDRDFPDYVLDQDTMTFYSQEK